MKFFCDKVIHGDTINNELLLAKYEECRLNLRSQIMFCSADTSLIVLERLVLVHIHRLSSNNIQAYNSELLLSSNLSEHVRTYPTAFKHVNTLIEHVTDFENFQYLMQYINYILTNLQLYPMDARRSYVQTLLESCR